MSRRLTHRTAIPAVLTALVSTVHTPARSELLYFTQGGRAQVPATVRDGFVRVEAPFGSFTFREKGFLKIVPGHSPEREWRVRRATASTGGVTARIDAAWWALENGLIPECLAMLRAARDATPTDRQPAHLADLADRLDHPCPDPETTRLRRALGAPFEEARSAHVLLLHQHEPGVARERLELLERVVAAFYLWFAFQGVDLPLPNERLVSVYYREHEPYLRFLEAQNAGAFRGTLGYYHPTFRVVVAYDPRNTGKWKARLAEIEPRTRSRRSPDEGSRRLFLGETDYRAHDHGTAAHELVHLLVAVSGLAPEPSRFPYWLHEGLAAQFEVVRGGRWAGIGRANDLRLPHWRALPTPPRLLPLIRDSGFGHGYQNDLYAESWALVYFLSRTRPAEFRTWLDLIRNHEPLGQETGPNRVVILFEQVFGEDFASLEEDWLRYMATVSTPLEGHATAGPNASGSPRTRPDNWR
jgi:hypothetical protein